MKYNNKRDSAKRDSAKRDLPRSHSAKMRWKNTIVFNNNIASDNNSNLKNNNIVNAIQRNSIRQNAWPMTYAAVAALAWIGFTVLWENSNSVISYEGNNFPFLILVTQREWLNRGRLDIISKLLTAKKELLILADGRKLFLCLFRHVKTWVVRVLL